MTEPVPRTRPLCRRPLTHRTLASPVSASGIAVASCAAESTPTSQSKIYREGRGRQRSSGREGGVVQFLVPQCGQCADARGARRRKRNPQIRHVIRERLRCRRLNFEETCTGIITATTKSIPPTSSRVKKSSSERRIELMVHPPSSPAVGVIRVGMHRPE